jgi:hypothetical protein
MASTVNSIASDQRILGALRWFYSHPSRYVNCPRFEISANSCSLLEEFPNGIIPLNRNICALTQAPDHEIEQEGKAAVAFGVSVIRASSIRVRSGGKIKEILGFPDVLVQDAYRVDGTQQYSEWDQSRRFNRGPR